jgi:hypothetical protein
MSKTRKNRSKKNFLKKITNTGKRAIPVVETGLKTVGKSAKVVAVKSVPIVEKGVSKVYGTMIQGFDLGVKGVQGLTSKMSKTKRHYKGRK